MAGITSNLFPEGSNHAEKTEQLVKSMDDSVAGKGPRKQFVMKNRGVIGASGVDPKAESLAAAARQLQEMQKGLDPAQAANIQAALDEIGGIGKDITAGAYGSTPGVPGNLRPYDLEAPAKILVPRFTPLRNEIPRVPGQGGAREFRRILGYSNAQIGGVPDLGIFLDSEVATNTFGGVSGLRRGPKISYNMDVHTVAYVEASVSDSVTYKAQFANMGFENTRSLSAMALLWAHMIGEEKAMLFGRGQSSMGYAGALGLTAPASSSYAASATTSGGTLATGSYTLQYTVRAGVGEGPASTAITALSVTGPNGAINVTTQPAIPAAALGLNWYATLSGTTYFVGLQTSTASNFQVTALGASVGTSGPPSADTTAGASTTSGGYDGLLTVLTGPQSGYVATGSGAVATNGDKDWQTAFEALYQRVFADPDEVWLNVNESKHLGDYFRSATTGSGGSGAFRINFNQDGTGQVGSIVTDLYNQSSPTRKQVPLRVHPYMPVGASIIRSRTLDIPDSGVGDTSQIVSVQEYMGIDWPEIQFTYDASTYWFGTFVHYAPAWSGAITQLS